jgi:hypothetical protein
MSTASYPVRVDARLDPGLSRWLWLVKWLLAIPHYVVLAFLWVAFMVLSVVAFFAILFTGRYPRAIFDFNVGVLRWTWRVAFYAYGALGTDRYPPFTLGEVPDYPAHLEIPHPERLSRGLVLVKWWLLALPHYLVVGFFVGGTVGVVVQGNNRSYTWATGLIGLMVLIAAVALLVTGSYPRSIFDFVLGMERWTLRVAAYAALMTDVYPPFRLDAGGEDPSSGHLTIGPPPGADPPDPADPPTWSPPDQTPVGPPSGPGAGPPTGLPPGQPPTTSRWTAGRIIAVVVGSVLVASSLGGLIGGVVLLALDRNRDSDGFLGTTPQTFSTSTRGIVADSIPVSANGGDWAVLPQLLGDARVRVTALDGGDVFVGVAPSADVTAYLSSVDHETIRDFANGSPLYRSQPGGEPSVPPGQAGIWVTSASGPGTQTLQWPAGGGTWSIVVMHPDAAAGVAVRADVGATLPVLHWAWVVPLAAGGVMLLVGLVTLLLAVPRTPGRPAVRAPGPTVPRGPAPPPRDATPPASRA